jgi:hypothetical protein
MDKVKEHSILEAAQEALKQAKKAKAEAEKEEIDSSVIPETREIVGTIEGYRQPLQPLVYLEQPAPPAIPPAQKFGDIPDQIRESEQINTFEVKKHNLASALESLELAVASHTALPSPDAAFAVSGLSELVMKLTKDIEKSQDPKKLYDQINSEILQKMVEHIVFTVGSEMKWLITESQKFVPTEKQSQLTETIKNATRRVAPSLNEVLEIAQTRLLKTLNLKETK